MLSVELCVLQDVVGGYGDGGAIGKQVVALPPLLCTQGGGEGQAHGSEAFGPVLVLTTVHYQLPDTLVDHGVQECQVMPAKLNRGGIVTLNTPYYKLIIHFNDTVL